MESGRKHLASVSHWLDLTFNFVQLDTDLIIFFFLASLIFIFVIIISNFDFVKVRILAFLFGGALT